MQPFFKRLCQMDEMSHYILLKAQRNAYLFLAAALLLWSLYESCQVYLYHTPLNLIPCLLLAASVLVQAFSQAILLRNAVKDDTDAHETGPLFALIALLCAVIGILAAAVAAVVLMGARV